MTASAADSLSGNASHELFRASRVAHRCCPKRALLSDAAPVLPLPLLAPLLSLLPTSASDAVTAVTASTLPAGADP